MRANEGTGTETAAASESAASPKPSPQEVVIITGLSGAGRSTAANALEDIGFFVIDLADTSMEQRVCFGCDVRSRRFFELLDASVTELHERQIDPRIVFCEASDEVLLRRFEESRRPHPLASAGGVAAGIRQEREMLGALKARADLIIDTSDLNPHELREKVKTFFSGDSGASLKVAVQSFGFKRGAPRDADIVLDVRFLPNPHWVEKLRPLPGTSEAVTEFVMDQFEARRFLEITEELLDFLLPQYVKEGKSYLTIAIGCTGGHHRSVVLGEEIAAHIRDAGYPVTLTHRDLRQ